MEISESLLERFKKEIPGYQSTISIDTTLDKDIYRVNYIEVSFIGTHAPFFSYSSKYMNISSEIRDMNIDKILSYKAFEDLSHIEIDKELNKIPTDKLLKMYRKGMKVNCGRGDIKIKRILNDREHIEKKGEVKIINWFH
jgi:hypothetical protein